MSPIMQPSNQIRLTNVSVVRLKKGKKRFEVACYPNKILEWRQGVETDSDNVLQIPDTVFLNVSKGQTAPRDDLDKAFGKGRPVGEIVLEILNTGEIQVGEKERAAQLERVHNEVIAIVVSKLVDPRTKRVYTPGMIEKALDILSQQAHQKEDGSKGGEVSRPKGEEGAATAVATAGANDHHHHDYDGDDDNDGHNNEKAAKKPTWTGVVTTKSAKSQALEAMKALIAHQPIPVARARMRLRITCAVGVLKQAVKSGGGASSSNNNSSSSSNNSNNAASALGGGGKGKKGKGGKNKEPESEKAAPPPPKGEDADVGAEHKAPGTVKDRILSYIEQVETQNVIGSEWEVVGFVEPGSLKTLSDLVGDDTKGQGRVEVLDMTVTHED